MSEKQNSGEYIIEFVQHGNSVKVSAMDSDTLTEVSIVGPASASQGELQATVIRKLEYVMRRTAEDQPTSARKPAGGRGGIIV